MRLGTDFSQWGGPLAESTVECWKQQGVSHAIVQYSDRMSQHLDTLARVGGIETEGYVYLYWGTSPWGQTPQQRTRLALNMAGARISFLWLDAEDTDQPFREDQLLECVEICKQAGMPCGIYTGNWWWPVHGHNSQAFKHLPLWDAYYISQSPQANLDLMPDEMIFKQPYGGWSAPTIWQWHNTTLLCGHSVDLNVLADSATPTPTPVHGDYDMKTYNSWAAWFNGKEIDAGADVYVAQAVSDFALPKEAKSVVFQSILEYGNVQWFHGNSDIPVASMGQGTFIGVLDELGTLNFSVSESCKFKQLRCIGYNL